MSPESCYQLSRRALPSSATRQLVTDDVGEDVTSFRYGQSHVIKIAVQVDAFT